MSERAMPTMGPVYAAGSMHLIPMSVDRGRVEEWCGNVYPTENNTVKYRGNICSIQSASCIDGIGPREAEANSVLIAAAFNAATEARAMGFDPIGAVQALPECLRILASLDEFAPLSVRAALAAAHTRKEMP